MWSPSGDQTGPMPCAEPNSATRILSPVPSASISQSAHSLRPGPSTFGGRVVSVASSKGRRRWKAMLWPSGDTAKVSTPETSPRGRISPVATEYTTMPSLAMKSSDASGAHSMSLTVSPDNRRISSVSVSTTQTSSTYWGSAPRSCLRRRTRAIGRPGTRSRTAAAICRRQRL